jgi:hypothetical protein
MSGAEVLVVLKFLPLAYQAADKWLSISQSLTKWTAFQPWLKRIVSTLEEENMMFGLVLKCLLLPIQDDLEARGYRPEDPDLSLFQDGFVQEKLRTVLPPNDYPWIMEKIFIISTTTKKILAIFSGNDGKVSRKFPVIMLPRKNPLRLGC